MSLNIPVPITELERIGTLQTSTLFIVETGEVTSNTTWSGLLSRLVNIPDSIIFGFGSVELPSVAFGDSTAGFYAPQRASVAISTNYVENWVVGPSGVIEFGPVGKQDTTKTTVVSPSTEKCDARFLDGIIGEGNLSVSGNLNLSGFINFDDLILSGEGDGGNLNAIGPNTTFGVDCTQTLTSYNVSRTYCKVIDKENIQIQDNLNNHLTVSSTKITTLNLLVQDTTTLTGSVFSALDISVQDGNGSVVLGNDGDLDISGDLTSGKFFGDGSGLTNLNIPISLRIKGSIDPTTTAPPGTPQDGDLWYSTATGVFVAGWDAVEGDDVRVGQSFYYRAITNTNPTSRWVLGGLSDLQSPYFMLIDLDQTVTGEKTHDALIINTNNIDVGTADINPAETLTLSARAFSALTVTGDPGNTLTTRSYVEARMTNAILDFALAPSKYIIGQSYDGSSAKTWDMDASPTGVDNLVLRNNDGNFNANIITAVFLDGRSEDAITLDINVNDNDTDQPIMLVQGQTQSQTLYVDSDFTYNPSTNNLTVGRIIGNVTGDVTGNVDTTTAFETERTLWSQPFDGTANVSADIVNAGSITPETTSTHDIIDYNNVYADTFHGRHEGAVEIGDKTEFELTNGIHILDSPWDGSVAITWDVRCESNNVDGNIVVRDEFGSFAANIITSNQFIGDLTGNTTGDISGSSGTVSGNSATFTALQTTRTLWSQPFDATGNITGELLYTGDIKPSVGSTYSLGSPSITYKDLYVDTIHGPSGDLPNNTTSADKVNNALTRGNYWEGVITEWDGSATDTWYVDPQSETIPNKTVLRSDPDRSFSSNVITADRFVGPLTGNTTGDITGSSGTTLGNAATTTRLETPRTIWGQTFDGTADISGDMVTTGNVRPDLTDTRTIGNEVLKYKDVYATTFYGYLNDTVSDVIHTVHKLKPGNYIVQADGSGWDGSASDTLNVYARTENIVDSLVLRSLTGDFTANRITSDFVGSVTGDVAGNITGESGFVTGNAATATKMETSRDITVTFTGTLTGSGSFSFDGTTDTTVDIDTQVSSADISGLAPLP